VTEKPSTHVNTVYTVGHKKRVTLLLSISSPIIDQFSKLFHCHILQTIGNKVIVKISHHTLTVSLHYRVKHKFSKITKITIIRMQKNNILKQCLLIFI